MPEYRRLVSYLYFYNKGVKSQNAGFVKAERRNGAIRLWVNLKGTFVSEKKMHVYFFVRREEMLVGIRLGELFIRGGAGEFKTICSEDSLGAAFEELGGIYIKGESLDNLFASQWDDLDFFVDKIIEMKDFVDKKNEEEPVIIENCMDEIQAVEEDIPEQQFIEPKIWEMPIKESIYVQELSVEEPVLTDETERRAEEAVSDAEPLLKERSEEYNEKEVQDKEADSQGKPWDDLFLNRTQVELFADDEIYDCVEIAPQDILKLPEGAGAILSNSFLNHGFFNFHHLILGRKYNADSKHGLVLGVPGVYNRREKMTANMFGFVQFKFSMRSDVRMNHFGYWYKEY